MPEFRHLHSAHCESGATAALLRHGGLELSEAMVFGIGSGIFFFYPPFVRVVGMPLISFRSYPGRIFSLACKRLGVTIARKRFWTQARGVAALDELLDREVPVGIQTNMFWLTYFPREFRSQFNAHNLIALRREGDVYHLSDPVLQDPVQLHSTALERARFAKGVLAPRGALYYPSHVPSEVDLPAAIKLAVRHTADLMLKRAPIVGVRGIRRLAGHVRGWGRKVEPERRLLLLGHVIRMQEEVGTGGAGFRYLYAAFLQEAGELLGWKPYSEASARMTAVGDTWRAEFAKICGRIIKGRNADAENFDAAADTLLDCARQEEEVFRFLFETSPSPRIASPTPQTRCLSGMET